MQGWVPSIHWGNVRVTLGLYRETGKLKWTLLNLRVQGPKAQKRVPVALGGHRQEPLELRACRACLD